MKVTLVVANPLLRAAKAMARKRNITMRSLVERGLELALAEQQSRQPFRLRDASFGGNGLQPEVSGFSWEQLLAYSYQTSGEG